MPIKPENMSKYPGGSIKSPEWLKIRERIQERAGDRCERCGVDNGRWIVRSISGRVWRYLTGDWDTIHQADPGEVEEFHIPYHETWRSKPIKVVCTVAHVDGSLEDHSDDNLAFWCQRCHNRHDAKGRAENAARTRKHKQGILDLLEWSEENG